METEVEAEYMRLRREVDAEARSEHNANNTEWEAEADSARGMLRGARMRAHWCGGGGREEEWNQAFKQWWGSLPWTARWYHNQGLLLPNVNERPKTPPSDREGKRTKGGKGGDEESTGGKREAFKKAKELKTVIEQRARIWARFEARHAQQ